MSKKILHLDMDGVIADFESKMYELWPHIELLEKGSKEQGDEIDRCCSTLEPGIFGMLELMPYAKWAVENLNRHYEMFFLSTPMWLVPQSYMDKRLWIERMFGEIGYKKLILTHNKGLVAGDYLVDDRIKNGVATFKGQHIHFGQEGFIDWLQTIDYLSYQDGWVPTQPYE